LLRDLRAARRTRFCSTKNIGSRSSEYVSVLVRHGLDPDWTRADRKKASDGDGCPNKLVDQLPPRFRTRRVSLHWPQKAASRRAIIGKCHAGRNPSGISKGGSRQRLGPSSSRAVPAGDRLETNLLVQKEARERRGRRGLECARTLPRIMRPRRFGCRGRMQLPSQPVSGDPADRPSGEHESPRRRGAGPSAGNPCVDGRGVSCAFP